jgi:hypothetical protein
MIIATNDAKHDHAHMHTHTKKIKQKWHEMGLEKAPEEKTMNAQVTNPMHLDGSRG